jgi:azurin
MKKGDAEMKKNYSRIVLPGFVVLALSASELSRAEVSQPAVRDTARKAAPGKAAKEIKLQIGAKKDELAFDKTTLKAQAGVPVSLTFKNTASPSSGLQHNFVLVQIGKEMEVANAGIAAGPDKAYVPASPDVLAHTRLLNPGESETISFTAPAQPGDYPYICSFPGHATTMKGVLKVK